MLRLTSYFILGVFVGFNAAVAEASGVQRVLFHSGDRYIRAEINTDSLLHFEVFRSSAPPQVQEPIYTTPMVMSQEYPGPEEFRSGDWGFETRQFRIEVLLPELCLRITDLKKPFHFGKLCFSDWEEPTKHFSIHPQESQNLYGLGNYFFDGSSADGDWSGKSWVSPEFGNMRYYFLGGFPSLSQFPVLYMLGRERENLALFLDHPYRLSWNFEDPKNLRFETWGDHLRFYLIGGENLLALRGEFMGLVGKPPVPPKSLFGLWVSKFGYTSWKDLQADLEHLREGGFPVDGFALDIQWFGGRFEDPSRARMGSLQFDLDQFPEPAQEIRRLFSLEGVRLMAIEEPYVDERLPEYEFLRGTPRETCFLVHHSRDECHPVRFGNESQTLWWGRGGMIDWTHPVAGDFWHQMKRHPLSKLGIFYHWTDLGEPEMYDPYSYYYGIEPGKNRHGDVHNLYGFKWLESIAQGYHHPERQRELMEIHERKAPLRHFSMARAGAPGIQRLGAGLWSGDIGRNLGSLRAHLNTQMHLSLAGLDYYNSDVGGFLEAPWDQEPGSNEAERYSQWFANSALGEIPLRPHGWAYDQTHLSFSPAKVGCFKSNLANLRLRYELFPYLYSLAHRAYLWGEPIFPPLVYFFQEDPNVRRIGNVKMIGPSLLYGVVAGFGQRERRVYLPRGKWVNYHTHAWHESRGAESEEIPLYLTRDGEEEIFTVPLFLKAGAIVPHLKGPIQSLSKHVSTDFIVQVVADEEASSFIVFEDDGETLAYQRGEVMTTEVVQRFTQDSERACEGVKIHASRGGYDGAPQLRRYRVDLLVDPTRNPGRVNRVQINGVNVPGCSSEASEKEETEGCWRETEHHFITAKTPLLPVSQDKEFEFCLNNR